LASSNKRGGGVGKKAKNEPSRSVHAKTKGMTRLKFLVFALVALGLWGYHVLVVSPLIANGAIAATAQVSAAPQALALWIESRRSLLSSALSQAQNFPALHLTPKAGAKPEAPNAERLSALRTHILEALPELKASLVVLLSNDVGALMSVGEGEAGPLVEGVTVGDLKASSVITINSTPYLLLTSPTYFSDKGEVKISGLFTVGAPILIDAKSLGAVVAAQNLSGLAVLSAGKSLVSAGNDVPKLEAAVKNLKAGQIAPIFSAPAKSLGPLELPLLVSHDQTLGLKQPIQGTPFELVASSSLSSQLEAAADYQTFALAALVGLLVLALVVTALLGEAQPLPMQKLEDRPVFPRASAPTTIPIASALPAPAPPAEASPEDFEFPAAPVNAGTVPVAEPTLERTADLEPSDPFARMAPLPSAPSAFSSPAPSSAPPVPSSASLDPFAASSPIPSANAGPSTKNPFGDDDGPERTAAYSSAQNGGIDPFALAAAQEHSRETPFDDAPEATRVAAVPQELLKASKGHSIPNPMASVPRTSTSSSMRAVALTDEDRHYQETFKDFIATREKCGEPADGLTFDKFKAKLLKNKEQLVAKYSCKSVRFQVYVKDGKAALKATPVKE
jgi:hypothetical protein